jgi:hypothetical protein
LELSGRVDVLKAESEHGRSLGAQADHRRLVATAGRVNRARPKGMNSGGLGCLRSLRRLEAKASWRGSEAMARDAPEETSTRRFRKETDALGPFRGGRSALCDLF